MRIKVRLPRVEPEKHTKPKECPKCGGRHFKPHGVQGEQKIIRDLGYEKVKSFRQRCLRCGYKVRAYPRGISSAQQSDRLKAITVLLYVLGLSYGAVSDFGSIGLLCMQDNGVQQRAGGREESAPTTTIQCEEGREAARGRSRWNLREGQGRASGDRSCGG